MRLLLEHGADPNARERPATIHIRCTGQPPAPALEIVRALLDAGGDVHGVGDVHELDAIGWAAYYHAEDGHPTTQPAR